MGKRKPATAHSQARQGAACSHTWERWGKSAYDRCTLCGERRAAVFGQAAPHPARPARHATPTPDQASLWDTQASLWDTQAGDRTPDSARLKAVYATADAEAERAYQAYQATDPGYHTVAVDHARQQAEATQERARVAWVAWVAYQAATGSQLPQAPAQPNVAPDVAPDAAPDVAPDAAPDAPPKPSRPARAIDPQARAVWRLMRLAGDYERATQARDFAQAVALELEINALADTLPDLPTVMITTRGRNVIRRARRQEELHI